MKTEELLATIGKVGKEAWDKGTVDDLSKNAEEVLSRKAVDSIKDKCFLVWNMLCDYKDGVYKDIPTRTLVLITGAIVYCVCPLDLIPDFLPFAGMSDDVLVVSAVVTSCVEDILKYQEWRNSDPLKRYLDTSVGFNKVLRTAEIERLSSMCSNCDIIDVEERASSTVTEIYSN